MNNVMAVIGTAGRADDSKRINRKLYDAMFQQVVMAIEKWKIDGLVSGGAAVADHLAVRAFLEGCVSSLTLYLPAQFRDGAFVPNSKVKFNPGATTNRYHKGFSESCGVDSLAEIERAIDQGAKAVVVEGFHRRNSEVADNASHMLAMTFGVRKSDDLRDSHLFGGKNAWNEFLPTDPGFSDAGTAGLKDGGTAHCWGECWRAKVKMHCNLFELVETSV